MRYTVDGRRPSSRRGCLVCVPSRPYCCATEDFVSSAARSCPGGRAGHRGPSSCDAGGPESAWPASARARAVVTSVSRNRPARRSTCQLLAFLVDLQQASRTRSNIVRVHVNTDTVNHRSCTRQHGHGTAHVVKYEYRYY